MKIFNENANANSKCNSAYRNPRYNKENLLINYFPLKSKSITNKSLNHFCIYQVLIINSVTKNTLYEDLKISAVTGDQYKQHCNLSNTAIGQTKKSYLMSQLTLPNVTCMIWRTINRLANTNLKNSP